jgi:hypothetical protein
VQISAPGSLWASGLSRCVADLGQESWLLTARRATAQSCLQTCACHNICDKSPSVRGGPSVIRVPHECWNIPFAQ